MSDVMAHPRSEMLRFMIIGLLSALCLGVMASSDQLPPVIAQSPTIVANVVNSMRLSLVREVKQHKTSPNIPMDKAMLTIVNNVSSAVELYAQIEECWKCPQLLVNSIPLDSQKHVLVDTRWRTNMTLRLPNKSQSCCSRLYHFGEYGEYVLLVSSAGPNTYTCTLYPTTNPIDSNLPIYICLAVVALCIICWTIGYQIHRKKLLRRLVQCHGTEGLIDSDLGATNSGREDVTPDAPTGTGSPTVLVTKPRIKSLDTFRGLCILLMVFVNYGGGKYWFFKHSTWNGLTVADVVFPWFTFIMGTSIALSLRSMLRRGSRRVHILLKVLRRTVFLFALGLMVSNTGGKPHAVLVDVRQLRILGVLQRLAVSYMVVALMEVCFAQSVDVHQTKWWASVRDLLSAWPEWLLALGLLGAHVCITFLLPVPGCVKGYLGPGGLHENGTQQNCTGGAAGYIDRLVFGHDHMYNHPTCKELYQTTVPFDPEGILGTLTSIFICFLGLQAGKILTTYTTHRGRLIRWIVWSFIMGIIAGVLCNFSKNDGVIPLNKNLWSVSFVLALASMAFFILSLCYLLCDTVNAWTGTPFFYPGMNPIVVYMGHELLHRCFPVQFHVESNHAALLAMNAYGAALWLIVSIILYIKRIFIAI